MTSDPRAALSTFIAALETHLELSAVRRGDNDPAVITAYNKVADAFVAYDDALLDAFGEVTPLDVYSEEDDDLDEDAIVEEDFEDDEDEFDDDEDDDEDDDGDEDFDELDDDIAEERQSGRGYLGLDEDEYDLDGDDPDAADGDDDSEGPARRARG